MLFRRNMLAVIRRKGAGGAMGDSWYATHVTSTIPVEKARASI